jgi:hypothetical protein
MSEPFGMMGMPGVSRQVHRSPIIPVSAPMCRQRIYPGFSLSSSTAPAADISRLLFELASCHQAWVRDVVAKLACLPEGWLE